LPLAGAAALAAVVSILRVCVIVLVVEPSPILSIAPAALVAALCFAACGALLLLNSDGQTSNGTPPRNPFELGPLLLFALLFAIVSTANAALAGRVGGSSLLVTSALSGTFDVDVAVLSTLRLVGQSITSEMAGTFVLAALAANAVGRVSIAIVAGPIRFWAPLAAATIAAIGLGFATFALLPPF
jgi:uncharacterized membrane protein (DUF4010 family)